MSTLDICCVFQHRDASFKLIPPASVYKWTFHRRCVAVAVLVQEGGIKTSKRPPVADECNSGNI